MTTGPQTSQISEKSTEKTKKITKSVQTLADGLVFMYDSIVKSNKLTGKTVFLGSLNIVFNKNLLLIYAVLTELFFITLPAQELNI